MDAIPCAIYAASMTIFRSDVATRLGCNEQQCCYIQILERISYLSYTVRVASSCDDLIALHHGENNEAIERHVLVTTVSRQDLHQHCTLILAPQAADPLYAAPAAILADKDLLIASAAWLTYFKVLRHAADGSVEVRVAALPHRVETDGAYTTTLTAQQFALALPIGRHELNLATCDLLELVESHAQAVTGRPVELLAPVVRMDEEEDAETMPAAPSYPPEVLAMVRIEDEEQLCHRAHPQLQDEPHDKLQQKGQQQDKPQLLETVYVSAEIATRTIQQFTRHTGTVPLSRTLSQKAWLQAALFAIKEYRAQHGSDEARLALQDERLRVVLVSRVFHATRLVWVEPVGELHCAIYRGYNIHIEKLIAA